jgi:DNA-binding transcriptional ArsR family regulator
MDTFSAVADPRRRAMLDLLVKHERSAGELVHFQTLASLLYQSI